MDDVGGRPSQDGWEPDDDRGGADEDFATVVFDEDFVRSARIHEPTAVERLVAAAEARAEAEAARPRSAGGARDGDPYDLFGTNRGGYDGARGGPVDPDDADYEPDHALGRGPYGPHGGALRPYRSSARWHRPVAWLLALLMGIGMVALAFSAVYRGSSADKQDQLPPATSGVDSAGPDETAVDPADGDRANSDPVNSDTVDNDPTSSDSTGATGADPAGTEPTGIGSTGSDPVGESAGSDPAGVGAGPGVAVFPGAAPILETGVPSASASLPLPAAPRTR